MCSYESNLRILETEKSLLNIEDLFLTANTDWIIKNKNKKQFSPPKQKLDIQWAK